MIRYSLLIIGRVQGVGFRYFAQLTACRLNLTGWCRNLADDSVHIEVQGIKKNIDSFIATIKLGNNFCRVDDVNLVNLPLIVDEKKFTIKY